MYIICLTCMGITLNKSREVRADLWGLVLKTKKTLRVFDLIYRPDEFHGKPFVIRVDRARPIKRAKPLTPFSAIHIDKKKLQAFYYLSPRKLRHVIRRERGLHGDLFQRLLTYFEYQLHIVIWRTHLFKLPAQIRRYIQQNNVMVNYAHTRNPHLRASLFDLITFKNTSFTWLLYNIRKKNFIPLDHHLIISYRAAALVVMLMEYAPFFWFPIEIGSVFYAKLNK